jgi:hypothetical protein
VFEFEKFAKGTFAIANTLAEITPKGAITIIGGGDSVAAVEQAGLAEKMSHISTGAAPALGRWCRLPPGPLRACARRRLPACLRWRSLGAEVGQPDRHQRKSQVQASAQASARTCAPAPC